MCVVWWDTDVRIEASVGEARASNFGALTAGPKGMS
jgi:hypothetical protein